MNINLKIGLASLGTLLIGLVVGGIAHSWHETNELIRASEARIEASKELEKIFAEDQKEFKTITENIEKAKKQQEAIEELIKYFEET